MNTEKTEDILRIEKITRRMKGFFFLCFAALVIYGVLPDKNGETYVPSKISDPVFSRQYEISDVEKDRGIYALNIDAAATPAVSAGGAALVSADTGELIYGNGSNVILPMASTTKIMTALVVLESLCLDDVFTVPAEACGVEGSSIYLSPGEKITIRDLLYGLMLESGNDAATALAIACSGSTENFVKQMNQKAKEIGLTCTSFANPHGLSADGHFTTAYELARITYHAMQNPTFREIVSTKSYTATDENGNPVHYFSNHNKMLRTYSGATGVKTGYTIASGRCLVTSAERNGSTFIAVTLNDRNDWRDHAAMLDFAFANYEAKNYFAKGELTFTLGGAQYSNGESASVVASKKAQKLELDVVLTAENE